MYLNWLSFMLLECEHCEFQAVLNLYYYIFHSTDTNIYNRNKQ